MDKTIEVLEILKGGVNNDKWGKALSKAIQALKALAQAEKVLGEKKVFTEGCFEPDINYQGNCTGFDQLHDIAKPIIAQRDLRIEELNTKILEMEYEAITDGKRIERWEEEARRIRLGMCDDYGDDPIGVIDTFKKELQSLSKENEVLREQNLDAVKDYKELQSLKSKLSRENLENVIDTEGLGIHFEEMGNSIGVYQALRKQLVQAIQKACGINDGGGE